MSKSLFMSTIFSVLLMAGAGTVGAQMSAEHKDAMMDEADSMMTPPGEGSQGLVEVGNKICPVSGEEVGDHGPAVTVEYEGKIYNLCCAMCKKDFLKDPQKYSKLAEDEMK